MRAGNRAEPAFPFRFGALPFDCTITVPYWSSAVELTEVLELARQGNMRAHVQRFPLSQVTDVYQRLRQGGVDGRARDHSAGALARQRINHVWSSSGAIWSEIVS